MLEKIIVDADFCLKLGGSEKYRFLFEVLPLIAGEIYMHRHAFEEVRYPASATKQLSDLIFSENSKKDLTSLKKCSIL